MPRQHGLGGFYYPDPRSCEYCGIIQEAHRPFCAQQPCLFCKKPGHVISECHKCPACQNCRQKPHATNCPQRQKSRHIEDTALSGKQQTRSRGPSRSLPPTVRTLVSQGKIPIFHSANIPIEFPSLNEVLQRLTVFLSETNDPQLNSMPYASVIQSYGIHNIVETLKSSIDTRVIALEGKRITTQLLHDIRKQQQQDQIKWPPYSGYLDYITDDRDSEYWRAYVGQSKNPRERINQHIKAIMQNSNDTLHYYVLWKGNGARSANFIRLWTLAFPEHINKNFLIVCLNILEMVMARAFQSLPAPLLHDYFGPLEGNKTYSHVCLNVIPPTLQSIPLRPQDRQNFTQAWKFSSDPDMDEWPKFRCDLIEKMKLKGKSFKPRHHLFTSLDYENALKTAIETLGLDGIKSFDGSLRCEHGSVNINDLQRQVEIDLEEVLGRHVPLINQVGNQDSRIGIALNNCLTKAFFDGKNQVPVEIPLGLQKSGFKSSNSLIWPACPYNTFQEMSFQNRRLGTTEKRIILNYNRAVIDNSGLKVIIMCGNGIQDILLEEYISKNAIEVKLNGCTCKGFVEIDDYEIKRVYLESPPLSDLFSSDWKVARKLSQVISLAVSTTKTPGVISNFYGSKCALSLILRSYVNESSGGPIMTLQSLHPSIREWLAGKCFITDEDIAELASKGRSLSQSIYMLYTCLTKGRSSANLKRLRDHEVAMPSHRRVHSAKCEKLDKCSLEEIRDLHQRLVKRVYSEWDTKGSGSLIGGRQTLDDSDLDHGSLGENRLMANNDLIGHSPTDDIVTDFILADNIVAGSILGGDLGEDHLVVGKDSLENADLSTGNETISACHFETKQAQRKSIIPSTVVKTQMDLLNGRKYTGSWKRDGSSATIHIHSSLLLTIRTSKIADDQTFRVWVEVKPDGQRHSDPWAYQAKDYDPGRRIGIRVAIITEGVEIPIGYTRSDTLDDVKRANTLVDWMSGHLEDDIVSRPRRCMEFNYNRKRFPPRIPGPGTYYTDDEGKLWKSQHRSKDRILIESKTQEEGEEKGAEVATKKIKALIHSWRTSAGK